MIAGAGSITVILPDGWAVNDDRLGKSMGSKTIKVSRTPAPGAPLLVLYGSVGMGIVQGPSAVRARTAPDHRLGLALDQAVLGRAEITWSGAARP